MHSLELLLGEDARANGQYLFTWGDDAAYYYAELAIASAITPSSAP